MTIEDQQSNPQGQTESHVNRSEEISKLLAEHKKALVQSGLPKVDVADCLKKLGEKPVDQLNPDHLRSNIAYLLSPESKKGVEKQHNKYAAIIDALIKEGLFSKDPKAKEKYMKWLMEQIFDEREKIINESFFKIGDRKKAAESWKHIPEAERKNHPRYDYLGVEERLKLVEKLTAKHKKLKADFLKLPKEFQSKYREKFKAMDLNERELFMKGICAAKTGNKNEALKNFEQIEHRRLIKAYDEKMWDFVGENLFSPRSVPKYQTWFKALSLEEKKRALIKSSLDNPERKTVRDQFLQLPLAVRKTYDLKFRNVNLKGRKKILEEAGLKKPTQVDVGKQSWFRGFLKRVLSSSSRRDATNKMESFSIASEVAERRRRFRVLQSTSAEKRDEKAAKEGLGETLQKSKRVETAAKSEKMHDEEGNLKLKLDVLETEHKDRHQLRRALKPDVYKQDAMLAGNISLQTKEGVKVTDERAYQQGELKRELAEVETALNPIIEEGAKTDGVNLTQQQIQQLLEKEDWRAHAKENIQKAV